MTTIRKKKVNRATSAYVSISDNAITEANIVEAQKLSNMLADIIIIIIGGGRPRIPRPFIHGIIVDPRYFMKAKNRMTQFKKECNAIKSLKANIDASIAGARRVMAKETRR